MKMSVAKKLNDRGFTLLEVMTSMLIMGFALLLLLHLAMVALDGNKWASGTTSSTQLLQEKLEKLRNSSNPASGMDTVSGVVRHWTVTSAGSHLRQINMQATWVTPDSLVQTYTVRTLVKTDTP
jgi:prepilin-type N-terminal cleavage/methylation domain-containing protein